MTQVGEESSLLAAQNLDDQITCASTRIEIHHDELLPRSQRERAVELFDGVAEANAVVVSEMLVGEGARTSVRTVQRALVGHRRAKTAQAIATVPEATLLEMAVLKGIAAHYVMRADDRVAEMTRQRDLLTVGRLLLSELAPLVNAQHGIVYVMDGDARGPILKQLAGYADTRDGTEPRRFQLNEGLVGQCAADGRRILVDAIPEDAVQVSSGLVAARARNVIALPVLYEGQVKAVIELASLREFTAPHLAFLEQLTGSIGVISGTAISPRQIQMALKLIW